VAQSDNATEPYPHPALHWRQPDALPLPHRPILSGLITCAGGGGQPVVFMHSFVA
jgi:hypothetical protein